MSSMYLKDETECMALSALLRGGRAVLNMTQQELADLIDIDRTTLLRMESGKHPIHMVLFNRAMRTLQRSGVNTVFDYSGFIGLDLDLKKLKKGVKHA